jgi:ABC-type Fe3+-hydroxamate transport system substrate-binding protein
VGRTRYCIHPRDGLRQVADIGGTKRVDVEKIKGLRPDFILAEKEENPKEMVDELALLAPVYVTDVVSILSAIAMCRTVGELVGLEAEGRDLASRIQAVMDAVKGAAPAERALYLIWRKPWMAAGTGTFIHSCLEHLGMRNAVGGDRYPELDEATLVGLDPDRVFLSSEPFPFRETHLEELRALLPRARVELVDGELFSWYGSRMLQMPAYWRALFPA